VLKLPLQVTHNLLKHPVTVFEVVYGRNGEGEAQPAVGPDTTISANVQPAGYRVLQLLPEGAQTEGAMVMHTDAPIYVADNGQPRQTYVRHAGQIWKATSVENWTPHSRIGRWILTRHLDINAP
jgi:hypothetical protein